MKVTLEIDTLLSKAAALEKQAEQHRASANANHGAAQAYRLLAEELKAANTPKPGAEAKPADEAAPAPDNRTDKPAE